ncbi:unnamed protein product [Rhizoctonia solani]|uniref:NACHT domain-containing protein n=1 Tax=Rhizoctonia solani TaxID=456999 RepID=A0A8H3BPR7_9AGAM|nr:unnamed protein product [Rhizoctonia solani]
MDSESSSSGPKGFSRASNYLKVLGRKAKNKLRTVSQSASTFAIDDSETYPSTIPTTSSISSKVYQSEPALSPGPLHSTLPIRPEPHATLTDSSNSMRNSNGIGWEGLRSTLEVLHGAIELFPPLQSAVGTLVSCLGLFETAHNNRQEYDELASELQEIAASLMRHLRDPRSAHMIGVIINISKTIDKELKLIAGRQTQSRGEQIIEARHNANMLLKDYKRIQALFRRLQIELSMSAWSAAHEHLIVTRLENLNPAKLAPYDSTHGTEVNRRACTKNTRETVLQELNRWSDDSEGKRIYWMNGMAGTGKTTIACTLAQALDARGQLAGNFFCSRSSPECRDANRIVPTIAYQLARFSTPFRASLFNVLDGDPDIGSRNITSQFERLLKYPLTESKDMLPGNLVVIIDALDECDSPSAVKLVLEVLLKFTSSFPIKFFVTSRPEPRIYDKISQDARSPGIMHLHEIEHSIVRADIELYLKEELSYLAPKEAHIFQLSTLAGNLFIYAATAVRYIHPDDAIVDSEVRLGNILSAQLESSKKLADIDNLYSAILTAALKNEKLEIDEIQRMQLVLWTVVCLREPADIDTLTALVGMGEKKGILAALKPLRSVLHVSETSGLVSTLHASFPDYIFSRERANGFFCDKEAHHQALAASCFRIMSTNLRFNICNLASSFVPDSAVLDLDRQVSTNISSALFYACQYWGDHFILAFASKKIGQELSEFLSHGLLFWMEVLNLKNSLKIGLSAMSNAQRRATTCSQYQDIRRSITDAHTFLTRTIATPILQSTPHIYISALQFCPRSSSIFTNYGKKVQGLMDLSGTAMTRREMAPLAMWQTEYGINCFELYADGNHIASGSSEGTVSIWDATNGMLIAGPTEPRGHSVHAIGISSNCKLIVAGYEDGTMFIWDATNGLPVSGPFRGHVDSVLTVAFFPDNTRVVSGSRDHTICIWNAVNGALVNPPLEGHTNSVHSIAVSPDGKQIVSGSADYTIRIWDSSNGTPLVAPLKGHAGPVWSVRFSPDGTKIASGADDNIVLVWKVTNMMSVSLQSTLEGHTEGIVSVDFSPNSTQVVSTSYDCTIRVWDVSNGATASGPFERPVIGFQSVGFSPYGTWFYSGSSDGTVCLWDATTRTVVDGIPRGHTDSVESVQFSPDGTHIVSGSEDHTICLWDASQGNLVTEPFRGHTAGVLSVAFSPDGTRIVSGGFDRAIFIWDPADGKLIVGPCMGHNDWVKCVEFSPNGAFVASCSDDGTICVWNATQSVPIVGPFKPHTGGIFSVGFSPDGTRLVSGGYDSTICISDSTTGELLYGPYKGHSDWISSVSFSPNGKLVVSGSGIKDRTVRIWHAVDGKLACDPLQGHNGGVLAVAFSPNGKHIASSSDDRTIRLWDSMTGDLVGGPLKAHTQSVRSVRFSPDGRQLVSGSRDKTIRVHDLDRPLNHNSALNGIWEITDDGWFKNEKSELLFWAPPELRRSFPRPYNPVTVGPEGSLQVDYSRLCLGGDWHKCYKYD